jgi:site-specific DNA-methyltransferase (adenine-specific)
MKANGSTKTGNRILTRDNLKVLQKMESESVELIYIDPPFNTGRVQKRPRLRTVRDEAGDRTGFGGRRYRTEAITTKGENNGYHDQFDDFLGFLRRKARSSSTSITARSTTAR